MSVVHTDTGRVVRPDSWHGNCVPHELGELSMEVEHQRFGIRKMVNLFWGNGAIH